MVLKFLQQLLPAPTPTPRNLSTTSETLSLNRGSPPSTMMRQTHIPAMYIVENWQNFKLKEAFAIFILYFCLFSEKWWENTKHIKWNSQDKGNNHILYKKKNQSECESKEMCFSKKNKKTKKQKKPPIFPLAKMQIVLLIIMRPLSSSRNWFRNLNFPLLLVERIIDQSALVNFVMLIVAPRLW